MKKFLDSEGLTHLWGKISMADYPNNETLVAVINAIDEQKADRDEIPSLVSFLQKVYPVGAVYISAIEVDPAILFGFGTWEQIKDTFLLASGDTNSIGTTGGEAEHTLTIEEIPAHTHQLKTDLESPDFDITWPVYMEYNEGWIQGPNQETEAPPTNTSRTGGGQPHNNMPPYLTVHMWKRTA